MSMKEEYTAIDMATAAGLADLTAVRCQCCATEYPHDSYDAGFIAGSGMCQVCDAAMPPKDLPAAGSAELIADAERCLFVMREIGSMDGDDITGDDVDLRFEDDEGRDTGCDVSIVDYAEKSADVIEKLIASLSAQQSAPKAPEVREHPRYVCRKCKQETRPPEPYTSYVLCDCGYMTAATTALTQQSAQPEFCCELSFKAAKQATWGARDLAHCKCDHNEYCEHCWPDDFKEGGKWHNGFEAQQSAPERVSVPEARVTGAWESARIGDFNAGWNACRDSVLTLLNKTAYMELDTTKRSIAIQDEVRALLNGGEA